MNELDDILNKHKGFQEGGYVPDGYEPPRLEMDGTFTLTAEQHKMLEQCAVVMPDDWLTAEQVQGLENLIKIPFRRMLRRNEMAMNDETDEARHWISSGKDLAAGPPGLEEEMEAYKHGIMKHDPVIANLERWHKAIMDAVLSIGTCTDELVKATRAARELDEILRSERMRHLIDLYYDNDQA